MGRMWWFGTFPKFAFLSHKVLAVRSWQSVANCVLFTNFCVWSHSCIDFQICKFLEFRVLLTKLYRFVCDPTFAYFCVPTSWTRERKKKREREREYARQTARERQRETARERAWERGKREKKRARDGWEGVEEREGGRWATCGARKLWVEAALGQRRIWAKHNPTAIG